MSEMKKSLLKTGFLLLALVIIGSMFIGCTGDSAVAETRTVTDMYDRQIEVPTKVNRVACLPGPSYELIFMLGGKDQLAQVRDDHRESYPLANLTNPDLINYAADLTMTAGPKSALNIEEFINADLDVVVYYGVPQALDQFSNAGIPSWVTWFKETAGTIDESITMDKKLVRGLADLLGNDAPDKAEEWCQYLDEKVAFIKARTEGLAETDRPNVYIGNSWGTNPLATWAGDSEATYTVALCGGVYVAAEITGAKFPEVSLEQVIAWQPDVIIMDCHGRNPNEVITTLSGDPDWAVIPAVKDNKMYRIPSGVFFMDKASTEPVYFLWLAQKLQPELFADVDIITEMKYYYKTFYGYDLTTTEAEQALAGWGL
jgi:iron complex transport system substrate-binding protein